MNASIFGSILPQPASPFVLLVSTRFRLGSTEPPALANWEKKTRLQSQTFEQRPVTTLPFACFLHYSASSILPPYHLL